ncbi:MAG: hypothetical protein Q9176_004387 [Flavoplaca citrina]
MVNHYYSTGIINKTTGRTQWDPPQAQHGGAPPLMGSGYGSAPGHGVPGGSYSQQYNQCTDSHSNQHRELREKKGKSGKGGILAAGTGGLAVSVLLVARWSPMLWGDDSDEERKMYAAEQQPAFVQETNDYQYGGPPMVPPPGADHGSVSSSDKEDLQKASEDHENASASDEESARDEYEEQYEDLDLR